MKSRFLIVALIPLWHLCQWVPCVAVLAVLTQNTSRHTIVLSSMLADPRPGCRIWVTWRLHWLFILGDPQCYDPLEGCHGTQCWGSSLRSLEVSDHEVVASHCLAAVVLRLESGQLRQTVQQESVLVLLRNPFQEWVYCLDRICL